MVSQVDSLGSQDYVDFSRQDKGSLDEKVATIAQELLSQIQKDLPYADRLRVRTIDWRNKETDSIEKILFFSVPLPDMSSEDLQVYQDSLKALEEIALPKAFLNGHVKEVADNVLTEVCSRTWKLLNALEEVGFPNHSGLSDWFQAAETEPSFGPIKKFSGNVGSNLAAIEKVVNSGNMRERMFFLIHTVRNLLAPTISALTADQKAALQEKLGWPIPEFTLQKGRYFAFSNDMQLRRRKTEDEIKSNPWLQPTIQDIYEQRASDIQFSDAEIAYIEARAKGDGEEFSPEQKVYFGNAAAMLCSRTKEEVPNTGYLDAIEETCLPTKCSISGVTSDILELCEKLLGLNDLKTKEEFRVACFASLLEAQNHSVAEIAHGAMSYGINFASAPNCYLHLVPEELQSEFLANVRDEMGKLGYDQLPHEFVNDRFCPAEEKKEA